MATNTKTKINKGGVLQGLLTKDEALITRLRALCKERNIQNMNQLAMRAGVYHSTLGNIFKGKTKNAGWKTVDYLAQGLGVSLSEFFDCPEIREAYDDD